ncbi:MAG TPA: hypothetical protein VEV45_20440 [Streptosporangiaceae bacterium]|nr:hypothetical protein [Streptosporangiaceae bacterium]
MGRHAAAQPLSPGTAAKPDVLHAWRVSQLIRLGLASPVADAIADRVDWHEVAELVRRGCPASLAVTIIE